VEDLVANVSGQIVTEMQDMISDDTNNNKELTYTQGLKIAWILAHAEHSEDNTDQDIDISFSDFAKNPGAIFGRSYEDIKDRYEVPYMHTMNFRILPCHIKQLCGFGTYCSFVCFDNRGQCSALIPSPS
jgi:hypothetical protein